MEPAYTPSYQAGQGDESPERREGFNERDEESASFSKYSNKSPTKINQGEGFDLAEGEEGMEDGSPMHRPMEETGEENEAMRRYEEQEAEILQYCEENNCLWEDKDFPPINSSIYTDILKVPEELREIQTITWVRPKDIAKDAKVLPDKETEGDMKLGAVGVNWFMNALLMVSTKPQILERIVWNTDHFDKGFVAFQFFKNGKWQPVIVDTLLPYDPSSKQLVFAQCMEQNEFWVPLIEKAYAKLHGSYEKIMQGHIVDALVDLTSYTAEKYDLSDPEVKAMVNDGRLWNIFLNSFNQGFIMGCINAVKNKSIKNPDIGPHGILENHGYGIIDAREFPKDDELKLVKIRNPWGPDGCWNGQFADDSEEWDKYRHIRQKLQVAFKSKKSEGTWWMSFHHLCEYLNKIYICRVFPENWDMYSLESKWKGKTAGGTWNVIPKPEGIDNAKNVQMDSDDKWFNNPQFRLKITKNTKLFITLMQEDQKLSGKSYVPVNLMIARTKDPYNRLWERPQDEDIVLETIKSIPRNSKREIGQIVVLKKPPEKKSAYFIIVPNNEMEPKKGENKVFWLRLFSSEPIDVVPTAETQEVTIDGAWNDLTAGGRIRRKDGKDNPHWCKNPQYFLNLPFPTHFKVILRRMTYQKKTRGVKIGLCICRYDPHQGQDPNQDAKKKENEKLAKTKSRTRSPSPNKNTSPHIDKLIDQTKTFLEPPVMEYIERRLNIGTNEAYIESSFGAEEVSALYFKKNPTEGPFIIVPCLEEEDRTATFKLTIFSNNPIDLRPLDPQKNWVTIGVWDDSSCGGSHLNEEPFETEPAKKTWTTNPKFSLQFKEEGPTPVWFKVTLQVADKNWKSKTARKMKNTIGGMIGIYVLERKEGKIQRSYMLTEPSFSPMLEVSEEFTLETINPNGYIIMPTTYEPKLQGTFIIAVTSNRDCTFAAL